ncbi:MAG: hypothetical protein ABR559_01150 [Gemmatimonadota bacterium]
MRSPYLWFCLALRSLPTLAVALGLFLSACDKPDTPAGPDDPSDPPGTPDGVGVSATSIRFEPADDEQIVRLANHGVSPVAWQLELSVPWLTATPTSGTLSAGESDVRLRVTRLGLAAGTHRGGARFVLGARSFDVAVEADVAATPLAVLDPSVLTLTPDDATATVLLSNPGAAPLTWTLSGPSWVALSPAAGTVAGGATAQIAVTPQRGALPDGLHEAPLTLTSNGGAGTVALRVEVAAPARLHALPVPLDFGATETTRIVTLVNEGGRPLNWLATASAAWLTRSPDSGTIAPHATQELTVTATRGTLAAGTHSAIVRLTSNGGAVTVPVTATVTATAPPPTPPPPTGTVALAGRVVDQFSGTGVAGVSVSYADATATTDANGQFTVPGTASGSLRALVISGPGVHRRTTFARSSDSRWPAIPDAFDMAAFNDIAREYEPRTIRWMAHPTVYIDTRGSGIAAGAELTSWITQVQGAVAGYIAGWSNGAIHAASVTAGSAPPPDGTPGTIVIHFDENASRYSGPRTVGLARTFWDGSRIISSGIIWLRFSLVRTSATSRGAVLGHELGHALGLGHMDGRTPSLMTPSISAMALTSFDEDAGGILYSRSPGNQSPDTDSSNTYRGGLVPSARPVPYEWVCGAPPGR